MKVLLVEDDAAIRSLLLQILEQRGYQVTALADGQEAWEACQREHFPLMLVDWGLPGIDGPDLCRLVRSLPQSDRTVILVITARVESRELRRILEAGANDYLAKPFDIDLLETRLTIAERNVGTLAERADAEAALLTANEMFRALICAAPVAIISLDAGGRVRSWNPAAKRIFGWTRSEMLGQPVPGLVPLLERLAADDPAQAPVLNGVELQLRRQDGTLVEISCSAAPMFDSQGKLAGSIVVALDNTERKLADEAQRQLLSILDATTDLIAMADVKGNVSYLNPAGRRMLGIGEADDVSWMRLTDFHTPREMEVIEREAIPTALRTGLWSGETRLAHLDGHEVPAEQLILAHRSDDGTVEFFSTIARDITPRKEAERHLKALAESDKLRALGQMASGVAHDLNQYLGVVAGHSDLALRYLERPVIDLNAVRDSLEIVIRGAMDGAETVKRLLAFARPRQEGEPQQVDLGEILRDTAKLTAPIWRDAAQEQGRPISLQVEATGQTTVSGWPASLKEAITNLIINAVDALPHGGTIQLRARQQGKQVVVEVIDSGVGMTPEVQENLFVPFFSTKGERGSGLGMPIVYSIIQRHQGEIEVESRPGHGTTFRLTFPAASDQPTATDTPESTQQTRPLRILAVDDEPVLGNMVAAMLRMDRHEVTVACSAEEAIERLNQGTFDLVLSDVGMGTGMNGWELARYIRETFSTLPVILVTGWGAQIEPEQLQEYGIAGVIAKPYRVTELRQMIEQALRNVSDEG